ncbi:MAG: tRNA lysidine(34) synthetase TilS [Bacteroidetes bacterium]|nr:tRNA lysidine(34) synthetase TilS [Bacteroidota bacterium]MBI3483074.1 tRNA lysidine(34) synthetase TilS [Bacteroidota bacterium]
MKAEFVRYVREKKLCTVKDKILLAISGGVDSMVMLFLFRESGFNISVAHANFQLRGEESNADEEFVKEYCQQFSIPFFTRRFETKLYAEETSLSTQMAARDLRYYWFNELIEKHHFDFVATAHHVNDSIETALLNFARGSGLGGFDGITPKNKKIIRPMLFATRQQIEMLAKENKINWREDSSNATDHYQRNFIRHNIIPLLKELNPSLENSFQDSIEKISGANELTAVGIRHWRDEFETRKNEQVHFNKKGFEGFQNPEGLLWNLIKHFGFNLDQCKQIIKSLHGQSGKKFFSHEFELVVDRELLIISKLALGMTEALIEKVPTEVYFGKFVLNISETENTEFPKNSCMAFLDASKLLFPLKWRQWKAGDYFHPLGMAHKKKLSDFFIDQKISAADKETITVLESGNQIVWVVGHRIDDNFKITSASKRILQFELTSSR